MAETLHVEEIDSARRFAELGGAWSGLADSAEAPVFLRWEWLFPWWSRLAWRSSLLILAARDSQDRLRGLLPLRQRVQRGLRVWSLLGDRFVGSDGLGPLVATGWEESAGGALAAQLAGASARWDILRLDDMPVRASWPRLLERELSAQSIRLQRLPRDVCPSIALGERHRPRRENLLRRRSWLERQPTYRLSCAETPADVAAALHHFFWLHGRRWGRRWSSAIAGPAVEGFHREAAPMLAASGRCRIHLMWLQGRPVAGVYALLERHAVYYYLPVFDPAWGHRSVGTVLLGLLVERAAEEGFERFELLRGEEPYKLEWANSQWRTCSWQAVAPRTVARLGAGIERHAGNVQAAVGARLPAAVVESWRLLRSRLSLGSAASG